MRRHWMWMPAVLFLVLLAVPQPGQGCTGPPRIPPPTPSNDPPPPGIGLPPVPRGRVGCYIDLSNIVLFPPSAPTTCVVGLGIGINNSAPSTLSIDAARVTILNTATNQHTLVPNFNFNFNPVTTAGFAGGPVLFPGATWFGFSAQVLPFTPPVLGPNEIFVLGFHVTVDANDPVPIAGQFAQFGMGIGFPTGQPDFGGVIDPAHPAVIVTAASPIIPAKTPEPASILLATLGLGIALLARRLSRNTEK